jgi:hypothetical protein
MQILAVQEIAVFENFLGVLVPGSVQSIVALVPESFHFTPYGISVLPTLGIDVRAGSGILYSLRG